MNIPKDLLRNIEINIKCLETIIKASEDYNKSQDSIISRVKRELVDLKENKLLFELQLEVMKDDF